MVVASGESETAGDTEDVVIIVLTIGVATAMVGGKATFVVDAIDVRPVGVPPDVETTVAIFDIDDSVIDG